MCWLWVFYVMLVVVLGYLFCCLFVGLVDLNGVI